MNLVVVVIANKLTETFIVDKTGNRVSQNTERPRAISCEWPSAASSGYVKLNVKMDGEVSINVTASFEIHSGLHTLDANFQTSVFF